MKRMFLIFGLITCLNLSATEQENEIARLASKMQGIIAKAKKDWPENYSMQKRQIEWESEAMQDMDKLSQLMKVKD